MRWSVFLLLFLSLPMVSGAVDHDRVASLAAEVNPAQNTTIIDPFFDTPASDVAQVIQDGTYFSFLVFLPFLVLPQILLIYVIFTFRDRRDGRKPAAFVHNEKLELLWTAIPIVALVVVAIPMVQILEYQDSPPVEAHRGDTLDVEVIGKNAFVWEYRYPAYDIGFQIHNVTSRLALQEAVVFEKGKTTQLFLTAEEVTHAWWVPAFGVKKDCYVDRTTHAWFTPTETGFYEGQCAELCGEGHSRMKISAVVLEAPAFKRWVAYQQHRAEAGEVLLVLEEGGDLASAVSAFLAADRSAERAEALCFWHKYHTLAAGMAKDAAWQELGQGDIRSALETETKDWYRAREREYRILSEAIDAALAAPALVVTAEVATKSDAAVTTPSATTTSTGSEIR